MGSKIDCICCGKRLSANGKRPLIINSLRIFVSARLFPSRVPDDCFICKTCRWMYSKWTAELNVRKILSQIDVSNEDNDRINEERDETTNGSDSNDSDMYSDNKYVG
jgi:hypothetical protein